jgi:hypothetical protein
VPYVMGGTSFLPATVSILLLLLLAVRQRSFKVLSVQGGVIFQGTMLISYALLEFARFVISVSQAGGGIFGFLKALLSVSPEAMLYASVKNVLRDYSSVADLIFAISGFRLIWEFLVFAFVCAVYKRLVRTLGQSEMFAMFAVYGVLFLVRSQAL